MTSVIPEKIQEKYQVVWRHHVGARYELDILQFEDFERTVDQIIGELEAAGHTDLTPEQCPYFGQLWAAAELLADEIAPLYLSGKKTLELGCGLAVPGIVAAQKGATVTALDLHPDTETFLALNSKRNQVNLEFKRLDWRHAKLDQKYDLILGSDILYESGHAAEVIHFLEQHLAAGGKALIVDPCRWHYQEFQNELIEAGFHVEATFCDGEERGHRIRLCTFTITWEQDHINGCGTMVKTSDGSFSLAHPEHGETYHSHGGALTEARNLYIESSGIRQFLADGSDLRVLDVGLGLGYNALVTLEAWMNAEAPGELTLKSLEVRPELVEQLRAGPRWLQGQPHQWAKWTQMLQKKGADLCSATLPHPHCPAVCSWSILIGDAQESQLQGPFDFVWQDPFSPDKNPPLWATSWFEKIRKSTSTSGTLVTYSVARRVRDALQAAGWNWEKIPAVGVGKQSWLKARPL